MAKFHLSDQLSPVEGTGLARDLRALWTFDDDFKNKSLLGARIDGTAENGASIVATDAARGGALSLSRASSQFVSVPRSFLDDNASAYTVSAWCKSTSLRDPGSSDRHFILESKVNNHVELPNASTSGYAISLGLRAASDPLKINLQLFTEAHEPKAVGSQLAPGIAAQGGFDWDVDRSPFSNWTHVAFTFDTDKPRLFVNGAFVKEHPLLTNCVSKFPPSRPP